MPKRSNPSPRGAGADKRPCTTQCSQQDEAALLEEIFPEDESNPLEQRFEDRDDDSILQETEFLSPEEEEDSEPVEPSSPQVLTIADGSSSTESGAVEAPEVVAVPDGETSADESLMSHDEYLPSEFTTESEAGSPRLRRPVGQLLTAGITAKWWKLLLVMTRDAMQFNDQYCEIFMKNDGYWTRQLQGKFKALPMETVDLTFNALIGREVIRTNLKDQDIWPSFIRGYVQLFRVLYDFAWGKKIPTPQAMEDHILGKSGLCKAPGNDKYPYEPLLHEFFVSHGGKCSWATQAIWNFIEAKIEEHRALCFDFDDVSEFEREPYDPTEDEWNVLHYLGDPMRTSARNAWLGSDNDMNYDNSGWEDWPTVKYKQTGFGLVYVTAGKEEGKFAENFGWYIGDAPNDLHAAFCKPEVAAHVREMGMEPTLRDVEDQGDALVCFDADARGDRERFSHCDLRRPPFRAIRNR
eukprot:gene1023-355_t